MKHVAYVLFLKSTVSNVYTVLMFPTYRLKLDLKFVLILVRLKFLMTIMMFSVFLRCFDSISFLVLYVCKVVLGSRWIAAVVEYLLRTKHACESFYTGRNSLNIVVFILRLFPFWLAKLFTFCVKLRFDVCMMLHTAVWTFLNIICLFSLNCSKSPQEMFVLLFEDRRIKPNIKTSSILDLSTYFRHLVGRNLLNSKSRQNSKIWSIIMNANKMVEQCTFKNNGQPLFVQISFFFWIFHPLIFHHIIVLL